MIISLWTSDVPSRQKILSYRQYVLIMSLISSWRSDPGTLGLHRHHMECWAKNSWSLSTTSGSPKLCLFFFDALVQRRFSLGCLEIAFSAAVQTAKPVPNDYQRCRHSGTSSLHLLVGRRDCLHNLGSAGGQAGRRPGGQAARRAGSRIVIVFTNI